jgi:tetratricopeptide (TPR) repeat protein
MEELAQRIGCSRPLIYQYVSGASLAQTDKLQQISRVVGKPIAWFFADETEGIAPTDSDERIALATAMRELRHERQKVAAESESFERERARERSAALREQVLSWSSPPDWRKVADTCHRLITILEGENDLAGQAEAALQRGNALIQINDWANARDSLERAKALFQEMGLSARVLDSVQSLGHVNFMLGYIDEAMRQFEEVAAGQEWWNRWQGNVSAGAVNEVMGQYTLAAQRFETAMDIANEREGRREAEIARVYIQANWANLELDCGDFQIAADRSAECSVLSQRHALQDQYVEALITRALALLERGNLASAVEMGTQALAFAQLMEDKQRCSISQSCLALCWSESGNLADAITAGAEAMEEAIHSGVLRAESMAHRALAEVYLERGSSVEAMYHADRGLSIALNEHAPRSQAEIANLRAKDEQWSTLVQLWSVPRISEHAPVSSDAC